MLSTLVNKVIDTAVTVDGAKTGATFSLDNAKYFSVVTVASGSSTPTGTTIQVSVSNDGTNWVALGSAVSVTGNGSFAIASADCSAALSYSYARIGYARSGGSYVANTRICLKGDS